MPAHAQVETVPTHHPVYTFLKRMEVKGFIGRYHDAVLPISRERVGEYLSDLHKERENLTASENGSLADFLSEFQYDISGSTEGYHSLIESDQQTFGGAIAEEISNREKFLYVYHDSSVSFFANGLVTLDARWIDGDALGKDRSVFFQFGGRLRGTAFDRVGYSLQATNAQFWGSRALLQRDRLINQSFALRTPDAKNFDFAEGYVRYDGDIFSVQIGRERLLWGNGYEQKLTLSENVRVYDFIRADAQYKSIKYTFVHAWLLGRKSFIEVTHPEDTSFTFYEPVVADKYVAAHRIEFSFPGLFDIGAQEMVVYSNRAPDLAYLNPLNVIESAQRSREERDNVFWGFDIQTHFIRGVEFTGSVLLDDIHFGRAFANSWVNRYAVQAGVMLADPLGIDNTSFMMEYTRVEPFVFSHNRSRDNDFGSLGQPLGPWIGPNADSWFFRADYFPERNLAFSVRVSLSRQGENVFDSTGTLIYNAGGNILLPHRDQDPLTKSFLSGTLIKSRRVEFIGLFELINQLWLEGRYAYEAEENATLPSTTNNHNINFQVRMEL
ncbi:MAG: capsule assembly Wzi family protein [Bacteroidota bacterium]